MKDMQKKIRGRESSIAILIINFNSGNLIKRCLQHLMVQTWTRTKIIVVDNASTDNSMGGLEKSFPSVHFIFSQINLGFAAGNNLALNYSDGCDWVALLNPDAFPEPTWLENLANAANIKTEFDFFGSLMCAADQPGWLDGTGDVYHVSGLSWRRDHAVKIELGTKVAGEIFGPCAAAAMYLRSALVKVGGFDEDYFCYHEDVDLAFRLRLQGYKCWYEPRSVVNHVGSGITGKRSVFSTYHGHRNLVWTFFKNMPIILLLIYLPWHLIMTITAIFICALRGQGLIVIRAKFDALKAYKIILKKRASIQKSRTVGSYYLLPLMARGVISFIKR